MSNPDNVITVDRMELADEFASYIMDLNHIGEPWMENEIPGDERSTLIVKPELQDEYCYLYGDAMTFIEDCEVRNFLNVDWELLSSQAHDLSVIQSEFADKHSEHDWITEPIEGILNFIYNLQDQFEPKPEE